MHMKYINNLLSLSLFSLLVTFNAQACFVTVTNDTGEAVMLFDINNPEEEGRLVAASEKTVFGNKTTKADFILAQKQSCGRWKKNLRITQVMCGMTEEEENKKEDKFVNVSGILNRDLGEEMADFFEIENFVETQDGPAKKDTSCGCKK